MGQLLVEVREVLHDVFDRFLTFCDSKQGPMKSCKVWESGLTGRILPPLLPSPLPGQGRLQSFLFSRLQVESVPFGIPYDVFLLHLPLEAAQGAFQGFAIMYDYICQVFLPFQSGLFGRIQAT